MNRIAYALDIGTAKTVCLAATIEDDELHVVSAGAVTTRGVKKGRIVDPAQVADCVKAAVGRVREETGADVEEVIVGVSGLSINSECSRGIRPMYPPGKTVHEEDLLQVNEHSRQIRFEEGYELLQTLPCSYVIDGEVVDGDPVGKSASRLEVLTHVMSVSSKHLETLNKIAQSAGVKVEEFVPIPLASGLGTARPEDAELGCVVVDIGRGTTDAALFKDGACVAVASIDVASQHITNDIAALIKVSPEDAERLKTEHGHAAPELVGEDEVVSVKQVGNDQVRPFPRKVLSEIIESRVREIATMLKDALLSSEKATGSVRSVLLTGGGGHLAGTDEVFKKVFGAQSAQFGVPRLVGPNSRKAALPEMSAACGLALFVLKDGGEELAPVAGVVDWKKSIRSLKSIFGKRS